MGQWHATFQSRTGPPCAFVPLQRHATAAPHRSVTDRRSVRTDARLVPRCCLSWGFVPFDTVSDWQIRCSWTADPSAAACRVRGLDTSFATSTTSPTGARSAGASMGFALQGVPLAARGAPLGVPALLTLPSVPPPKGSSAKAAAFRAFFLRRIRAVVRSSPRGDPDRRYLLELFLSRAFPSTARAIACSHDACPLTLGGDDVPTHLGLRASRIG